MLSFIRRTPRSRHVASPVPHDARLRNNGRNPSISETPAHLRSSPPQIPRGPWETGTPPLLQRHGSASSGGAVQPGPYAAQRTRTSRHVETVLDQPPVAVHGHGRHGVTEHPLDDLGVGTTGHGERRSGVPKLVRVQPGFADRGVCGAERAVPEHRDPGAPRRGAPRTTPVFLRVLAPDVRRQVLDEEPRDRHLPTLAGLRRSRERSMRVGARRQCPMQLPGANAWGTAE
jgi:hypothetical protein